MEAIRLHERVSRVAARARVIEIFERVGIPDAVSRFATYPHLLSGGLKQRVMIAMALAMRPKLLIADEPTTALDVTIQAQILALLRELQAEFGTTIVLITHDLGVVNELADRVAVMYAGRIVEEGGRRDIFAAASHPYTQGLLRSIPANATPGARLAEISGVVPAAGHWPPGVSVCEPLRAALRTLSRGAAPSGATVARPYGVVSCGGGGSKRVSNTQPAPLLQVCNLRTWFPVRSGIFQRIEGQVKAVDGLDLEIERGKTLALVGESGCGKTTVGRSILRLVEPLEGSVVYDGVDVLQLPAPDFRPFRRRIQVIMQDPASALDPRMTVRDAIAEGMEAFDIGSEGQDRTARVAELMRLVKLDPDSMGRYPHEFSGGQRQRICIARALAVDPELIICDEAVSSLDVSIQAQILNLLRDLQESRGLTYLFITHDLGVVRYFADRVAVMYLGRVVEEGPTERIMNAPRHPYTQALLASVPSLDPDKRGVKPAALGDVPSPANPPAGCHYHPRCAQKLTQCDREDPPMVRLDDGCSRCFLSADETLAQT